ncbi:unnamed protein product [Oppiella nova]|uniref:non-specific serine/threonine protein kinase n=1 Tax=Oppiella nova TaxID=334625 RepID=A0A7R9M8E2_9ACAR|nr:unnamed protein product [Oppiella nova]CAG2172550.1 unnamed protein product [Oppiella nova]
MVTLEKTLVAFQYWWRVIKAAIDIVLRVVTGGGSIKEIRNLSKVRSKYVVEYYDFWPEGDYFYIQMELCSDSLKNILQQKPQEFGRQSGEPMNSYEYFISCKIFREILKCVQFLHEFKPQIIHRDLKPDNILIDRNRRNGRFVKLGDFGLATVHDKHIHLQTDNKHTSGVGTQGYMAPEVLLSKTYDHKSDVYSLAIIGEKIFEFNVSEIDKN